MKAIVLERGSKNLSVAFDAQAIEDLIAKLKRIQQGGAQEIVSLESLQGNFDITLVPFDIQDKQIKEYFDNEVEYDAVENLRL